MNSRLRRSRTFWPDALTVAGVGEGHTHNVAPRYKRIFLLLMVLLVSMTLAVAAIWWRIIVSGEYREQQIQQVREQIRQGQCELLDTFPEGLPSLERARVKYRCGPGIPVDLLTPEEQSRLGGSPVTPAPASPATTPPRGSAASPDAPPPTFNAPSPGNGLPPESSPAPDPLVDLGPITDRACDLAGVCI